MTKTVDAKTLKQWLERGEAVLVDVREPGEHRAVRIEGAHLLPLGNVTIHAMPDASGKKLVVHCLKGGRGSQACERLLTENPALEIYNLEGGINSWSGAGLPVKVSGRLLPLDRQVQLTIGTFLLAAAALTYFVHPAFLLFVALIGMGLAVAGLTGFCGMARLIASMPWNQHTA